MNPRSLVALVHDIAAAAVAWILAYALRFNLAIPADFANSMLQHLLWVLPLQAAILVRLRLYRGLWRYASVPDLRRIVVAALAGSAAIAATTVMFQMGVIPRSVFVLYPLLLVLAMGGSRFAYRMWKEGRFVSPAQAGAKRVAILGAGNIGSGLLKNLRSSADHIVVGFFDDDPKKARQTIDGVPVIGPLAMLPAARERLEIEQAIIAMPGAGHSARRRAFEIAADAKIPAFAVPAVQEILAGQVRVSQLRPVELDDLLGRDPISLDTAGLDALLRDKVVLVTGAGGSIGAELCRQIAPYQPRRLVLLDASEFALYTIHEEFKDRFAAVDTVAVVGDVKDAQRLQSVFGEYRPAVVFHAAAYKHVPLMEEVNAWEAVRNNILGTYRVAEAADRAGTAAVVLISTDKAVNPTNVMGASKRVAELVCSAIQQRSRTHFVMVRFGNVLGSTGSVVPKFRRQIARGGPITVTHPDVTRYFMLIPEACQLVLQAGAMGRGGEIFVLDMGEPVKIVDLARDMVRLSGLGPNDIAIVYSGLRPGEKLFEEVLSDAETTLPTPHPKLRIARAAGAPPEDWLDAAITWLSADAQRSDDEVRRQLAQWVPEYHSADQPVS